MSAQTNYPARYYALFDTTATQPTPVTGWIDAWGLSTTDGLPAASTMLPLTSAQWEARAPVGQYVSGSTIVTVPAS